MIKAAIIGCGGIHHQHAAAINALDGIELILVCDKLPERAKASAEKNGCAWTTDYKEVLANKDVQAVHICTPHFLHAPMAIEAMEAGKIVLSEKPMGMSALETRAIIEAQERTGAYYGVCFQNRYRPVILKMMEIMHSPEAGGIIGGRAFVTWSRGDEYYIGTDWRGRWATEGGGVMINQTIHTIDLLQWMFGGVETVQGTARCHTLSHVIEVEDTVELSMTTHDGKRILFYGTNGYVENSQVLIDILCENVKLRAEESLTVTWKDGRVETFTEQQATGEHAYWGLDHQTLISDFYAKYAAGEKFPIGASEAAKAVEIIDKVYRSPMMNRV